MHLKVVLQGNLGHFDEFRYSKPMIYQSEGEFRELRELIGRAELLIADDLACIGRQGWPEIMAILSNFWCRGPEFEHETVKHFKKDQVLESSACIETAGFLARDNPSRCNIFLFRALTLAAAGFRKYERNGASDIEAIRDRHFPRGSPGEF